MEIPFSTLVYTCGECNYGGKVTDAHDRHTLMVILSDFYTPDILSDTYKFSESGVYFAPEHSEHDGYLEYISTLPILPAPEAFGMHENADINKDLQEVGELLASLMLTQSSDAGGGTGQTPEEVISGIAADITQRVPAEFDLEMVQRLHPQDYHESMNTVLVQELSRFNALLSIVSAYPFSAVRSCPKRGLCGNTAIVGADHKITAQPQPCCKRPRANEQRA